MNAQTPMTLMEQTQHSADWSDAKRYLWLLSPAVPLIGAGALIAYRVAPKKMRGMAWIGPILIHMVIPTLDRIIGEDTNNPPEEVIRKLEADPYYARIVKSYIPVQYLVTFIGAYLATRKGVPLSDQLGIALSVGVINGVAINTAHELSHKHDKVDQLLSLAALAPTGYGHFRVEHPYGHHKRAATPEDPASSKMGETFWEFLPRTVIGSFKSAIEIETRRLQRKGKGFWTTENELLQGWAMSAGLYATLVTIFGKKSDPVYCHPSGVWFWLARSDQLCRALWPQT